MRDLPPLRSLYDAERLLQRLIVEMATGRTDRVELAGNRDGTFAVVVTDGKQRVRQHAEIEPSACPHCVIWYLTWKIEGHPQLAFDGSLPAATDDYDAALDAARLPALSIDTTRGGEGLLAVACVTSDPDDDMPFTGECPKHARNGR